MIPGKRMSAWGVVGWERFSIQMEWWRAGRMNLFRGYLSTVWPPGHIWPMVGSEQALEGQSYIRIQNINKYILCSLSHFNHQILLDKLLIRHWLSVSMERPASLCPVQWQQTVKYFCFLNFIIGHYIHLDYVLDYCIWPVCCKNSVKYLDSNIF